MQLMVVDKKVKTMVSNQPDNVSKQKTKSWKCLMSPTNLLLWQGNAGITGVELMSDRFMVGTELFAPEERGLKHAADCLWNLKVKDCVTIFEHHAWSTNIRGNLNKQVDQHASDFDDDFLIAILAIVETCLDKSVRDVCGHHVAFLVGIDGRGDEDAVSGGSGTGSSLFGKAGLSLGTDTTAFDSAVFLLAKEHHGSFAFFFSRGTSLDRSMGLKQWQWWS